MPLGVSCEIGVLVPSKYGVRLSGIFLLYYQHSVLCCFGNGKTVGFYGNPSWRSNSENREQSEILSQKPILLRVLQ